MPRKYSLQDIERVYQHLHVAGFRFVELPYGLKASPTEGWLAEADWKPEHNLSPDGAVMRISRRSHNIAVVCGPGTCLVEADTPEALTELEKVVGDTATLSIQSPRRGRHYYFRGELGQVKGWVPGIETRGTGKGYAVGPGSVITDAAYEGKTPPGANGPWRYRIHNIAPVATIPELLLQRLTPPKKPAAGAGQHGVTGNDRFDWRPTAADWAAALNLELDAAGRRYTGGCPVCGGETRFVVDAHQPYTATCFASRCDYGALKAKVWPDGNPRARPEPRRPAAPRPSTPGARAATKSRPAWHPDAPLEAPVVLDAAGVESFQHEHWMRVADDLPQPLDELRKAAAAGDADSAALLEQYRPRVPFPHIGPKGQKVIGLKGERFDRRVLGRALALLDSDIAWNQLSNRHCYRGGNTARFEALPRSWIANSDLSLADLKFRIEEECFWAEPVIGKPDQYDYRRVSVGIGKVKECIEGRCAINQFDPFRDYLADVAEQHPDADPEYCRTLIESCFTVRHPELAREASEYLLRTPVLRSCPTGAKADIMPILFGAQGLGKSSFLQHLIPEEVDGFGDGVDFGAKGSDFAVATDGKLILEVPDLKGFRGVQLEKIKAQLTKRNDHERRPYGRFAITSRRRAVFVATENSDESLPHDPTGLRRFVVVHLTGARLGYLDMVRHLKASRDMFWASVQNRIARDGANRLMFSGELARQQAEVNEQHRTRDDLHEAFVRELDQTRPWTTQEVMARAAELNDKVNVYDSQMLFRLKRSMAACRWTNRRVVIEPGGAPVRAWHPQECRCHHCLRTPAPPPVQSSLPQEGAAPAPQSTTEPEPVPKPQPAGPAAQTDAFGRELCIHAPICNGARAPRSGYCVACRDNLQRREEMKTALEARIL